MSHEMRTPLNGVLGMLQVLSLTLSLTSNQKLNLSPNLGFLLCVRVRGMRQLAMSYELPTEVMQNVQNAYMSGEHLLNLVSDSFDASKIHYRPLPSSHGDGSSLCGR